MQQRRIKPKAAPAAPIAPAKRSGALQPRMLEGYSPATVIRLTLYLAAYQVVLLVVGVALAVVFPDLAVKILTALFFTLAIAIPGTLVWPALVLALRDRKATPEFIQGQMVGASPVSTVFGLGLLQVRTRQATQSVNIERKLLRQVPQNQVQVAVRLTPNLRHVSSLQVIGPRMAGGIPTEVPPQFRQAERFPLYAIGGAYGGIFGVGLVLLLLPLNGALWPVHVLVVVVGMALAALASRLLTSFAQKRLEASLGAAAQR